MHRLTEHTWAKLAISLILSVVMSLLGAGCIVDTSEYPYNGPATPDATQDMVMADAGGDTNVEPEVDSGADAATCGPCLPLETCGGAGIEGRCGCPSDGELCAQLGATCGAIDVSAECSSKESIVCGGCDNGEVCSQENVCTSDLTCGNEIIDLTEGEVCDDGNNDDGDGCSADCTSDETCGNDVCDAGLEDWATCSVDCGATSVASGTDHSCSVTRSGRIVCWGGDSEGQLGDGAPFANSRNPVEVNAISNAVAVAAGDQHTCAVNAIGEVFCWGRGDERQLGNGTTNSALNPVRAGTLTGITMLTAGFAHTCASDGAEVWCWGKGDKGQTGPAGDTAAPMLVGGITGTISGLVAGAEHSCAASTDGVWCWGRNDRGQLGTPNGDRPNPQLVPGFGVPSGIAAGASFTCALDSTNSASCWGANSEGQLGDGTTTNSGVPVGSLGPFTSLAAGDAFTCGIQPDGTAQCWGFNDDGQLGDGTTNGSLVPVDVVPEFDATSLAAGERHVCAALVDGSVTCWGSNSQRQLVNWPDDTL